MWRLARPVFEERRLKRRAQPLLDSLTAGNGYARVCAFWGARKSGERKKKAFRATTLLETLPSLPVVEVRANACHHGDFIYMHDMCRTSKNQELVRNTFR
jgi:hypothetical protein